jgi:hypothetical protein
MTKRILEVWEEKEKGMQLEDLEKGTIFPVAIINCSDPAYSGAAWLAFQAFADEMPKEYYKYGKEQSFWENHDDLKLPIGKGKTPDEALEDLKVKAKRFYESW